MKIRTVILVLCSAFLSVVTAIMMIRSVAAAQSYEAIVLGTAMNRVIAYEETATYLRLVDGSVVSSTPGPAQAIALDVPSTGRVTNVAPQFEQLSEEAVSRVADLINAELSTRDEHVTCDLPADISSCEILDNIDILLWGEIFKLSDRSANVLISWMRRVPPGTSPNFRRAWVELAMDEDGWQIVGIQISQI